MAASDSRAATAVIKTRTGPGALSVADTDALLYLPGHDPAKLRVALRIPALSPGWQGSFRDLLTAAEDAGSGPSPSTEPAWPGFRKLRVTQVVRETGAKYEVMDADVPVVESGGKTDFQYGDKGGENLYPPVKVGRVLHDRDTVTHAQDLRQLG